MIYLNNVAGNKSDTDDKLRSELTLAGLTPTDKCGSLIYSGEVKATIYCQQYGWLFKRAWRYWVAEGNGIPVGPAMKLWEEWGDVVRTEGHCGCPSPLWYNNGLATGMYHIDSIDGLKALADTLKSLYVERVGDDYPKGNWKR